MDDPDFDKWYRKQGFPMIHEEKRPFEILKACWQESRRVAMFDASFGCIVALLVLALYMMAVLL